MSSRRTTLRTLRAALPGAGVLADEGVSAAGSPESVRDKKFSSAREKKVLAHLGKVSSRASQGAAACCFVLCSGAAPC
jgi:hypothetical protein